MIRLVLVAILLTGCSTSSGDRNTLDSIPKAAAAALRAEAHGAEIKRVSRESEGGQELYEGSWEENGLGREAKVTASGKVVEVERELAPADVPAPVRDAATKALPTGGTIAFVLLMNGTYEAETVVAGKEHEAVFAADGKPAVGDGEDEDVDDDDGDKGGDRD